MQNDAREAYSTRTKTLFPPSVPFFVPSAFFSLTPLVFLTTLCMWGACFGVFLHCCLLVVKDEGL
jgi:hypothetical protein